MADPVYEVRLKGTCAAQYFENVYHFRDDGNQPGLALGAATLAPIFVANILPAIAACVAEDTTFELVEVKAINPKGAGFQLTCANLQGTNGLTSVTSGEGPIIECPFVNSANKYRTGKIFMPGIPTGAVVGNIVQPGLITLLVAVTTILQTGQPSSPYSFYFCIHEKETGFGYVPEYFYVGGKLGTQRRRLRPYP